MFLFLTNHKGWQAASSFAVLVLFAVAKAERKFSGSVPKWCKLLVLCFNRVSVGCVRWGSTLTVWKSLPVIWYRYMQLPLTSAYARFILASDHSEPQAIK